MVRKREIFVCLFSPSWFIVQKVTQERDELQERVEEQAAIIDHLKYQIDDLQLQLTLTHTRPPSEKVSYKIKYVLDWSIEIDVPSLIVASQDTLIEQYIIFPALGRGQSIVVLSGASKENVLQSTAQFSLAYISVSVKNNCRTHDSNWFCLSLLQVQPPVEEFKTKHHSRKSQPFHWSYWQTLLSQFRLYGRAPPLPFIWIIL